MKNIYLILSSIGLALLLSACGGGGGGSTVDSGDSSTQISVNNCPVYTDLLVGDTLVKEDDNTTVTIRDTDGNKDVCVNTGSAHIVR